MRLEEDNRKLETGYTSPKDETVNMKLKPSDMKLGTKNYQ